MKDEDFVSEGDYSFIGFEKDLDDIPDLSTLPDGIEVQVQLTGAEIKLSEKTGGRYIAANLEIIGQGANLKSITKVMMLPAPDDDEKKSNNRLRAVKAFYHAFKIPTSGKVRLTDYIGNTAWAILGSEASDEYGDKNTIRRFV